MMHVEDARKMREDALEEYKKLAKQKYLPKVEGAIKSAAKDGHSYTSIRLGGGFMDEPVPDKKVVDEVIRLLQERGFEAEDEFEGVDDVSGIRELHASRYGRTVNIKW